VLTLYTSTLRFSPLLRNFWGSWKNYFFPGQGYPRRVTCILFSEGTSISSLKTTIIYSPDAFSLQKTPYQEFWSSVSRFIK
jgi:hypothetical protein